MKKTYFQPVIESTVVNSVRLMQQGPGSEPENQEISQQPGSQFAPGRKPF